MSNYQLLQGRDTVRKGKLHRIALAIRHNRIPSKKYEVSVTRFYGKGATSRVEVTSRQGFSNEANARKYFEEA